MENLRVNRRRVLIPLISFAAALLFSSAMPQDSARQTGLTSAKSDLVDILTALEEGRDYTRPARWSESAYLDFHLPELQFDSADIEELEKRMEELSARVEEKLEQLLEELDEMIIPDPGINSYREIRKERYKHRLL